MEAIRVVLADDHPVLARLVLQTRQAAQHRRYAAITFRGVLMNMFRYLHLDKKLSLHWRRYVLQSLYATMAVFLVILLLQLEQVVIIASIGASAFIEFAMPQSITAKERNLIGGHIIGLLVGSLFGLVPQPSALLCAVLYALCVGGTIFLMVATDTEHPPAAGTALGVAMIGLSPTLVVSVVTSIIVLALVHHLLRFRLLDLV